MKKSTQKILFTVAAAAVVYFLWKKMKGTGATPVAGYDNVIKMPDAAMKLAGERQAQQAQLIAQDKLLASQLSPDHNPLA